MDATPLDVQKQGNAPECPVFLDAAKGFKSIDEHVVLDKIAGIGLEVVLYREGVHHVEHRELLRNFRHGTSGLGYRPRK